MWECPKCKYGFSNPEGIAKHKVSNPECARYSVSGYHPGWQGVNLDGNPKTRKGETLWTE